jgi:hypothetical protein
MVFFDLCAAPDLPDDFLSGIEVWPSGLALEVEESSVDGSDGTGGQVSYLLGFDRELLLVDCGFGRGRALDQIVDLPDQLLDRLDGVFDAVGASDVLDDGRVDEGEDLGVRESGLRGRPIQNLGFMPLIMKVELFKDLRRLSFPDHPLHPYCSSAAG